MIWNRELETMPRPQLADLQRERLRWSVRWAAERVPFYQQQFAAAGVNPDDIRSLDDIRRLPFLRKHHLREHYPDGLFAVPRRDIVRIHASSGTRGKPTTVAYTRNDIAVWAEVCARSLACAGATPESVIHIAYGYGLFTGGLGVHYGAETLGAMVVPASGGNTPRQIMLMQDFGADVLCCTPSYALNIADTMEQRGIGIGTLALKYGVFGAEPWTETIRTQIEQRLGLHALDIYGLSEVMGPGVSMQSHEDGEGLYIWEDHFYPEVIDPDSGEVLPYGSEGELVFTSLTKQAFPVIRYRTGDLCTLFCEPGPSGRTMTRMTRIKGRTDDMLIIRGVNVFPSEIERALLLHHELAPHYQIVLRREGALDTLLVRAELTPESFGALGQNPTCDDAERLKTRLCSSLHETLQVGATMELGAPGSLPRSEGKAVRVIDER